MGKSKVREQDGVRINEAFFWKVPRELKRKECIRDVHKRTEHQAVKEKETQHCTLCQRPQEATEEETLPFTD